jgi:hypothetical protein
LAGDNAEVCPGPDGEDDRRRDIRRPREPKSLLVLRGQRSEGRRPSTLDDQFNGPDDVRITTPTLLCNPAEKVHGTQRFQIEDRNLHLACYEIHGKQKTEPVTFGAENQFETDEFKITAWEILCAPAEKTLPSP